MTGMADLTMRGPQLSRLTQYMKAISVLNPDSISSRVIRTAEEGICTGVQQETRALYGSFNSTPSQQNNLNTFMEGEFSVEFIMYTSEEAASQLFQV